MTRCTCAHPPHEETRQCQYDKALAALWQRRAMTRCFDHELAKLNAEYPECARAQQGD